MSIFSNIRHGEDHRQLQRGAPRRELNGGGGGGRVLFPFTALGLANDALGSALRLARAEGGTLVPVFLARVPLHMPLDSPLPRQSKIAIPLQEAVEQRAVSFGVPVESRIERGRSYRHALRQMIEHERFDRIVLAAAAGHGPGFGADDVAWLLANAPGEIAVLRPPLSVGAAALTPVGGAAGHLPPGGPALPSVAGAARLPPVR